MCISNKLQVKPLLQTGLHWRTWDWGPHWRTWAVEVAAVVTEIDVSPSTCGIRPGRSPLHKRLVLSPHSPARPGPLLPHLTGV